MESKTVEYTEREKKERVEKCNHHSKNHRLFKAGRDLWRLPSQTTCSKQVFSQKVAQGCVLLGF